MSKYVSRTAEKVVIRMPEGLRDKIKAVAAGNHRSMNNLIVRMIEAQLEPTPDQLEDTWIPQIGQLVKLRDEFKVTYNVETSDGLECDYIDTRVNVLPPGGDPAQNPR